jgi:large subunit ribosomal protein L24
MANVKFKIKRDDTVIVTAGKHKGRTGKVLRVLPEKSRIIVEKVNLVKRHVRPQGDRPGGTVEKEAALHISNVALFDAESGKPVRVGWKYLEDGRKVRFNRKTGAVID